MTNIRARQQGERYVYIHNDLSNAAFYFKDIIERKQKEGGDGIGLDCMACLIMLAFTFEANINFMGDHFIEGWEERSAFDAKVKQVFEALSIDRDETKRPYSSVVLAKNFRDTLAHGKPIKEKFDEVVEGSQEELEAHEFVSSATKNTANGRQCYWSTRMWTHSRKQMMKAAKLDVWDTRTHGQSGLTVIEGLTEAQEPTPAR